MPLVHLSRHGQILPSDAVEIRDGVQVQLGDHELTALGREQAGRLGRRLAAEGFRGVVRSSPYRRAVATAAAIARACGVRVRLDPELQEIARRAGGTPGCSGSELATLHPEVDPELPAAWWLTTVESGADCRARCERLLPRLLTTTVDCALVGHGATVNNLTRLLLARAGEPAGWLDCYNAGLTTVAIEHGAVRVVRVGCTAHLDADQVTANDLRPADLARLRAQAEDRG